MVDILQDMAPQAQAQQALRTQNAGAAEALLKAYNPASHAAAIYHASRGEEKKAVQACITGFGTLAGFAMGGPVGAGVAAIGTGILDVIVEKYIKWSSKIKACKFRWTLYTMNWYCSITIMGLRSSIVTIKCNIIVRRFVGNSTFSQFSRRDEAVIVLYFAVHDEQKLC